MVECCRRKRGVKLSVVFVTVRFRIIFSVLGEKAKSTLRLRQKRGVKLIVVSENAEENCALSAVYSVFREEAKLCVFGEYTE
jgi:hypothetical protein